jgi:membrane protein DedA with SNARE-associated domain
VIALSVVERVVEWVEPVFAVAGYYIIAGAVLAERSILIGLVVPGDVILALGGVYAAQGRLSLVWVIVIGIIAAICGESIGYWLGRNYGMSLIRRIPFLSRLEPALEGTKEYFARHGGKTVAIGRYATAAGAFIPFTAGMAHMRYRRFLLFDVPAIVVWAIGISVFGYLFGENLAFIDRVLSRFGYIVLGVIAVVVAGWVLWKRRQREEAEDAADAVDQDRSSR